MTVNMMIDRQPGNGCINPDPGGLPHDGNYGLSNILAEPRYSVFVQMICPNCKSNEVSWNQSGNDF